MSTPIIVYRQMDAFNEPMWGQGQANLIINTDAVAQLIMTRLRLFEGEWWADRRDGLPWWQSILAKPGSANVFALIINRRILSTPYVLSIQNLTAEYNSAARTFTYAASVLTQFGLVQISNQPDTVNQGIPQ